MATRSDAGKGDRHRSWSKEFFNGYDKIDWSKKPRGEEPTAESTPPGSEEGLPEET